MRDRVLFDTTSIITADQWLACSRRRIQMLCRRNLLLFVAALLVSGATFGAPCPQAFVLDSAIAAQPCSIGAVTFSQFVFTVVQGAGSPGPNGILITSQPGSPNLSFSSTPLIFAPAGVTIQRGIGVLLMALPNTPIRSLTVDTTGGSTANSSRAPLRTYVCVGAQAIMGVNGVVSCPGDLLTIDSTFNQTATLAFGPATVVGVVHDFYIQAFPNTFGELESLRDTIGTTAAVDQVNAIPALSYSAVLALTAALAVLGARAARRSIIAA